MPRTARASEGDLCYHVLNRGNGRAEVFHKGDDYAAFLEAMAEASWTPKGTVDPKGDGGPQRGRS